MEKERTFAYLLLACKWSDEFKSEISDWYFGDIIEAFSEGEDQADCPEDIWSFEWEGFMDRVAPVQLTLGWDPRLYLVSLFKGEGIEPYFATGYADEPNNIICFDRLPDGLVFSGEAEKIPNPTDRERFDEVLRQTMEMARSQNRSLLFIGGWGWYYEMEVPSDRKTILQQAGLKFVNRHG